MKLNNKGFAVTTILYTLLIAFLMFLGAALAMFSTSSSLISNANEDLINGTELNVQQVKLADTSGLDYGTWFGTTVLVKINSRYGTMYWPRDFYNYDTSSGNIGDPKSTLQKVENAEYGEIEGSVNRNILAACWSGSKYESCNNKNTWTTGNQPIAYKQSSNNVQRLSYINNKSNIVSLSLDNTSQKIINELQSAADDIIDNGMLDEGSDIRNFISENLQNAIDNNDISILDNVYENSYNGNINIEVKYDDINKYLTSDISQYLEAKGISFSTSDSSTESSSFKSYIIKLNYNSPDGYKDISYNIIDYFYLIRNGSETSTDSIESQDMINYWYVLDPDASTAQKFLIALAATATLQSADNIKQDGYDISKYALTYLVGTQVYDNNNISSADFDDTPKFLIIVDTINGLYKNLNLSNIYE